MLMQYRVGVKKSFRFCPFRCYLFQTGTDVPLLSGWNGTSVPFISVSNGTSIPFHCSKTETFFASYSTYLCIYTVNLATHTLPLPRPSPSLLLIHRQRDKLHITVPLWCAPIPREFWVPAMLVDASETVNVMMGSSAAPTIATSRFA